MKHFFNFLIIFMISFSVYAEGGSHAGSYKADTTSSFNFGQNLLDNSEVVADENRKIVTIKNIQSIHLDAENDRVTIVNISKRTGAMELYFLGSSFENAISRASLATLAASCPVVVVSAMKEDINVSNDERTDVIGSLTFAGSRVRHTINNIRSIDCLKSR